MSNVTTSEDPVITKIAAEQTETPTIYVTDNILSTLMCATRSVYSWDILVRKQGNKIFLDKRTGGPLDTYSVNENATEPPSADSTDKDAKQNLLNTPSALAQEATAINHNFVHQVLKEVCFDLYVINLL